jgi:hypothetical protein
LPRSCTFTSSASRASRYCRRRGVPSDIVTIVVSL